MSYELNQEFGLGLKVRDIQSFIPAGNEVAVYYPYEVCNGTDVTKEMLIKYGFFEQFAKLGMTPDSPESLEEECKLLIQKSEEGMDVFVDLKQALSDLLKAQKKCNKVEFEEIQGMMHAVIESYLSHNLNIPNIFEISSSRFGTVHKLGGMIPDESYLIFRQWSRLDEDGHWYDPRTDEEDRATMEGMRIALVGDNHPGYELLSPIFGG